MSVCLFFRAVFMVFIILLILCRLPYSAFRIPHSAFNQFRIPHYLISHIAIAAAHATFSESTPFCIGILTV